MSDDLIKLLREPDRYGQTYDDKCEAADEIERLRAALEQAYGILARSQTLEDAYKAQDLIHAVLERK